MKNPTPVHAVGDAHETEKNWPLADWGAGAAWSVQVTAPAAGAAANRATNAAESARHRRSPACPPSVVLTPMLAPVAVISLPGSDGWLARVLP